MNNVDTSVESEEMVTGSKLSTVVPAQELIPDSHDRASADKVFTVESRSTKS